jgi:hypothetical protein
MKRRETKITKKGRRETKTAKGGHAKKAEGVGSFPILRCWRSSGTDDACGGRRGELMSYLVFRSIKRINLKLALCASEP